MAILIAVQDGNFTVAGTWYVVEAGTVSLAVTRS